MGRIFLLVFLCFFQIIPGQENKKLANGLLKYVVYDFDGLNIGQSNLPDGDFGNGLNFSVDANPLSPSDVIGDRVLKLNLTWQSGGGEFGKALMRYLELNASADKLNVYIYNPETNSGDAKVQLVITEDDNNDDAFDAAVDDKWIYNTTVARSGAWQLISVPLSSFQDGNSGGNGAFDAAYTGAGGMLFSVSMVFSKPTSASASDTYYIDMLCFSEGDMPVGSGILDLPYQSNGKGCALGALSSLESPDQTPSQVHSYLPPGKKITFVNWFMYYSTSGTTANMYPGQEVQNLIDQGYQPIITWESMFAAYSRLDPVQPRLSQINNGSFDAYIDAFAAKIKSYSGTVIMRIFHEGEGDWYSWSLTENGKDPAVYVAAFRHVVDRFRAVGANNVKWMWCLNAEPKPYVRYNWVKDCYPGDNYVDIVATDIYNHPDLNTPDWKSFRYTMAESYYYLAKYFSHKPIYICEVGCRERYNEEPSGSQSKADWICGMNRDLKSYFHKTEALVFFSMKKEHDWQINSSESARQAFINCIWNDVHYGAPVGLDNNNQPQVAFSAYPNPFINKINLLISGVPDTGKSVELSIYNVAGKKVYYTSGASVPHVVLTDDLPVGLYILELKNGTFIKRQKLIRTVSR